MIACSNCDAKVAVMVVFGRVILCTDCLSAVLPIWQIWPVQAPQPASRSQDILEAEIIGNPANESLFAHTREGVIQVPIERIVTLRQCDPSTRRDMHLVNGAIEWPDLGLRLSYADLYRQLYGREP